jgi:pimeloyl-ACP methyl ester carboxylesterase
VWFRGVIYILILIFGPPALLAYRIYNINPESGRSEQVHISKAIPFASKKISLITDDGVRIEGQVLRSPLNKKLVIIIHGYGMSHRNMINRANGLFPEIADILFLDLRNHGSSDKSHTTFGYYEALDVKAAIDHYRREYQELILWGLSMGAAASVRVVLLGGQVDMLILEGLYDDLSNAITLQSANYYLPKYPIVSLSLFFYEYISGVNLKQMDMVANLKKIKDIPILLVHSQADEEVPMSSYYRLRDALDEQGQLLLLEKGGHETIYDVNLFEYQKKIINLIINR